MNQKPEIDSEIITTLKNMAELSGRQLSPEAAKMFLLDLSAYPPAEVKAALMKCRRELRGFPSLADVVARIDDGRPSAEEAWALVPQDEDDSAVWTDEMREAYAACRGLLLGGDPIAARMAFREVYAKLISKARDTRTPVRWQPTLGHDKTRHAAVLQEALRLGRLTKAHVTALIPHPELARGEQLQITGESDQKINPLSFIRGIREKIQGAHDE